MRGRFLPRILLVVTSLLLTYVVCEAAYRLGKYWNALERAKRHHNFTFSAGPAPLYLFDHENGYRYKPASEFRLLHFDGNNDLWKSNTLRVNNMGHISPTDDFVYKPKSEFRVAVLGDSFTASMESDVSWPTVLENLLNTDSSLKRSRGVSTFKVMNFAMDGTGIVQFARIYQSEVQRFDPDLVIVNFITDDIGRKFIWRTTVTLNSSAQYSITLTCFSLPAGFENSDCVFAGVIVVEPGIVGRNAEISRIQREIIRAHLSRARWFSPYPQVLAKGLGHLGFRITGNRDMHLDPYYGGDEGVRSSVDALRAMTSKHPMVLILHHPVDEEIVSGKTPSRVLELMAKAKSVRIVPMVKYLPTHVNRQEIARWFNYPHDGHFNEYGVRVYGEAAYRSVQEYLVRENH